MATSVSKISGITLRAAADEAISSAGSNDDGAARIMTCRVPPYCGLVFALATNDPKIRLLIASHCQPKGFIAPCHLVLCDGDRRVASRLSPQSRYPSWKIQ